MHTYRAPNVPWKSSSSSSSKSWSSAGKATTWAFFVAVGNKNLPFDSGHSTLYTSLPHAQLKKQLHDLLERVFNTKGKSFIATNNFRTFWANDKTSPVESLVSLLSFLSITSTFALDARLSGRLLVYPWAPIVHLCLQISSFIPLSAILWSKQWNKTLQKPSSSATPFDISTTYSVLTMWNLEIASARFTRRNWNLRTHPHHLLKCVISTQISRLCLYKRISF